MKLLVILKKSTYLEQKYVDQNEPYIQNLLF